MQSQDTFFDDVARMMTGAMGLAQGVQDEARTFMRAQAERLVSEMDLVRRDEYEAMKQLAQDAKTEVEDLRARVERLEALLAQKT